MKHLFFTGLCVLAATLAGAKTSENSFPELVLNRPNLGIILAHSVSSTTARHNRLKLSWVQKVERQIREIQASGINTINIHQGIVHPRQPVVPSEIQPLHTKRVEVWKRTLANNSLLKNFHIVTLAPQDVVDMTPAQADYVAGFLSSPLTVRESDKRFIPTDEQELQRFLVLVTIQAPQAKESIYLVFNCARREIYVAYKDVKHLGIALDPLPDTPRSLVNRNF